MAARHLNTTDDAEVRRALPTLVPAAAHNPSKDSWEIGKRQLLYRKTTT